MAGHINGTEVYVDAESGELQKTSSSESVAVDIPDSGIYRPRQMEDVMKEALLIEEQEQNDLNRDRLTVYAGLRENLKNYVGLYMKLDKAVHSSVRQEIMNLLEMKLYERLTAEEFKSLVLDIFDEVKTRQCNNRQIYNRVMYDLFNITQKQKTGTLFPEATGNMKC